MLVNKKSAMKLRALYGEPGREPGFSPVLPACLCRFVGTLAVGAGEPTDRASPCMTWKAAAVTIGGTVIIVTFGALLMLTCDCAPKLCPDGHGEGGTVSSLAALVAFLCGSHSVHSGRDLPTCQCFDPGL